MDALLNGLPVAVCAGMDFEARIAEGKGIAVIYGQNRCKYRDDLHRQAQSGVSGFLSFGVAGGLAPELKPGDVVVAHSVITAIGTSKPSAEWSAILRRLLPNAHHLPVYGAETPVTSVSDKSALWVQTGAGAVDMESGPVAEIAQHYRLPFAVLRVILDPADRALPQSALAGARQDGTTDVKAVVRSLARRPQDLRGLMRLAEDNRRANDALLSSRQALGPLFGFGFLGAGKFTLDMEQMDVDSGTLASH